MALIPYSFIPAEKAVRIKKVKTTGSDEPAPVNKGSGAILLSSFYDGNRFRRVWSDGFVEEYENGSLKYSRLPVYNVCQADC